jgi:hypothetical protein
MVSPHFPPDSSAGTHRVRLLAPHLPACGWQPTVVTVDARDYEGTLDPELAALVPNELEVIRCRALPSWATRRLGVGDLGLRALPGLYRTCARLLGERLFDALFITIFPSYPALLGPILKQRFGVPFVLDYQDPWVSEWGRTVGGGPGGTPDLKARITRRVAELAEPVALRAADAITAVSQATYEAVLERHAELRHLPCETIPIGCEAADFEALRARGVGTRHFDPGDGNVHLCYVGTLLPLGLETLDALCAATARLKAERPSLAARLRLHFFGTSNQFDRDAPARVLPVAQRHGVGELVTEVAPRIGYLDAMAVQLAASGILLLGSSERHYTASKLFPALLARRPLLALYHEQSSVVDILRQVARSPSVRWVTYGDQVRAGARVPEIAAALEALVSDPRYDEQMVDMRELERFSARSLAQRLAAVLDRARGSA